VNKDIEVDFRLNPSFEFLPSGQRAERYRQLAKDALRKARDSADNDRRAEYFGMASAWHAMAMEMERIERLSGQKERRPRAQSSWTS